DGHCCSDYMVSSYTPALGALLWARESLTTVRKREVRALVAAVPEPFREEFGELPYAREEISTVISALPDGAAMALLRHDDATTDRNGGIRAAELLEKLPDATILHLACHGFQDPVNPLQSGFAMRDEMLTIEKLMPMPLPHAFFAYLSACGTAKGDKDQPDQAVHLAAVMLFAGFKSVIATLWSVSMQDVDGPIIAKSVYRDIFASESEYLDPDDVAYALDAAVQQFRQAFPDPMRWAPYIHLGI
ncbi:hypothetical protein PUNSTDRAFT_74190, partial [Punctularia strigosozonata HHB-11173 SS5]|uniref:uncharacterized protein n=1 Tax=Punctularia strigosozonata (strain HHB-11173) TaxID=741275 RepID=UPI0004416699